jgi:hypothetical protein
MKYLRLYENIDFNDIEDVDYIGNVIYDIDDIFDNIDVGDKVYFNDDYTMLNDTKNVYAYKGVGYDVVKVAFRGDYDNSIICIIDNNGEYHTLVFDFLSDKLEKLEKQK